MPACLREAEASLRRRQAGHGSVVSPGEYLLRLKDENGEAMPPYPAIMFFYGAGLTAEIDTILFLAALRQFEAGDEHQVSVNISAHSLHNAEFVKTVLAGIETLGLKPEAPRKIILEIHESTPNLVMNRHVLELFRKFGAAFAIDDVGLSLGDVFRLSEFEEIADYIKIDRKSVCADPEAENALERVLSLVRSLLPGSIIVAEGVQSVQHALEIHRNFPDIQYAQGLYLPDREEFAGEWDALAADSPRLKSG